MDKEIETLVFLWLEWLKNDKDARDNNLSMRQRRKAAERCEEIVNEKYKVIASIDRFVNALKRS